MVSSAVSPSMVGRADQLALLRAAQAATLAGRPQGVVVSGEAGIGKTRLLEELVAVLDDAVVARGQCVAMGGLPSPFAPVRQLLRDLLTHFGTEEFLRCAGPTGRLLPAILPELGDGQPAAIAQAQLYDAILLLLQNLSAEAPLVVVIEDVHWADPPTVDLLRELLHVFHRGRVLAVISYRTEDVDRDHPLRPFLQEVGRARSVTRVELDRLTMEESLEQARLIRDAVDAALDDDTVALVGRSDGVPFFVEELLALGGAPDAPLPSTLRELVLARYSRLPEETRSVLRLVAAGGVTVQHGLLAAVHEGGPAALDEAVRQAVAAQVLRADGTSYTFRHALTQAAVHDELLPGERARFHARYAVALEDGGRAPGRSAETAHHWLAAQQPARALPALLDASRDAASAGAPVSAAQLGEEALALWDRVPDAVELAGCSRLDLVRQVAVTYATAGHPRGAGILEETLAATPEDDPRGRALLLHDAMMVRHGSGQEGFLELGHAALDLLPTEDDDEGLAVRARVQCGLACAMLIAPEPGGVEVMQEAMALARGLAARSADPGIVERARFELRRGLTNLAWELYRTHDVPGALASLREVEELIGTDAQARLRHDDRSSRILLGLGRLTEAREVAARGMAFAREVGMGRGWGVNLALTHARANFALGDLATTARILRQVRQSRPYDSNLALCAALAIELAVAQDDLITAEQILRDSHALLDRVRVTEIDDDLTVASAVGGLEAARGEAHAAWAEVRHLWTRDQQTTPAHVYPLLALGARLLGAMRRIGADPPGETSVEAEQLLRRTLEAHAADEVADDWRAVLEAELSGPDGSGSDVDAWRAAVEAASRGRLPMEVRVSALRRLAQARLAAGDRPGGTATLSEARTIAWGSGLVRAVRLADQLAERAGVDGTTMPTDGAPTGLVPGEAPLTARERQVLELVARGLTNRQIGEQLFISAKTVSVHVSAILRKLGAPTRAQAAARAVDTLG